MAEGDQHIGMDLPALVRLGEADGECDAAPPTPAWRDPATTSGGGPVVVGNIPQRPTASRSRAGLLEQVTGQDSEAPVVFALTGTRGAGKTQLAAKARHRRAGVGTKQIEKAAIQVVHLQASSGVLPKTPRRYVVPYV